MVGRDGYMVMACWIGKDGGIDRFIFYAYTLTMPDIRQIVKKKKNIIVLKARCQTSSFHMRKYV